MTPREANADPIAEIAALRDRIASLTRENTELQEQQTATSEILRVISSSPSDARPVFDAILRNAVKLCNAMQALVYQLVAGSVHLVGHQGFEGDEIERFGRTFPRPMDDPTPVPTTIRTATMFHAPDVEASPEGLYSPAARAAMRAYGIRSHLIVPLLRNREAIGAIVVHHAAVNAFTDGHIELLKTFADQAVIAIENVRLFHETKEALDQQTATSEILRVISQSPTDVQPVFDTIAQSAIRLCEAVDASIFRVHDDRLDFVAHHGPIAQRHGDFSLPLVRGTVGGRSVLEARTVQVADLQNEDHEFPGAAENARRFGFRTILSVPLLHEGIAIGGIQLRRMEIQPFSERQIALLQTFADQAVIAIENVRLFTELEQKNRALSEAHAQVSEALERQTATSEILRVISQSPTDVQPVFDAIAESSVRLCGALWGSVYRYDGELIHMVAHHNYPAAALEVSARAFPARPGRHVFTGRAILERAIVRVPDVMNDPEHGFAQEIAQGSGFRSVVSVPMLRGANPIGAITVWHTSVDPFSDAHIELLKTFADQAVIAIENVRLFKELQASNRELSTALEQQTATSDILRVISRAHVDAQPVFDAIVRSAVRLCGGLFCSLFQFDGELIHHVAPPNFSPEALAEMHRIFPAPPTQALLPGRAILESTINHIPDVHELDPDFPVQAVARALGFRSALCVPMLREGAALGVISVARATPGPFSDTEIALLKTFADQAVIAIENVRLFTELAARTQELTRSVDQLTALGEVGRAVSSTLDLETVLSTIVSRAVQLSGLDGGVVFEYDDGAEEFVHRVATESGGVLAQARRATRVRKGEGVVGQTANTLEPVQVPDITVPGAYVGPNRENLIESGIRAIVAVPMVREGQLIGCLVVSRNRPAEFPTETIEMLRTFATQSALAIQNARLFHEIADKSRQLEAASQHKSEFLANMSHELRTPLNAIIGFSEVLTDRMFGELNEKQEEYLKDIYASGNHLLSLINDILDLSKIEAGRMELELAEFDLPTAIESALMLVRERAGRRSIALHTNIDSRLGRIQADERKVRQVVLNLLSNAIKFTPEGGRIDVGAMPKDGFVEVSVSDTGIGIAPEDQEQVFEEFRQVGTAAKKIEGTGLGLTLCRKFVELHGGRIWVKSELGAGATFTFTIPGRV